MSPSSKRPLIVLPLALLAALLFYAVVRSQNQGADAHQPLPVFTQASYSQARATAESEGKYLLVYATASWCPPCRQMKKETWPDPRVVEWVAQHGAAVMVDVDESEEAAAALRIEAMPTMVLFKGGAEIGRKVGGLSADDLLRWLNEKAG